MHRLLARSIHVALLALALAGCGARPSSSVGQLSEAITCVPTATTCSRAANLDLLVKPGSCKVDADCRSFGVDAICAQNNDGTGLVCQKQCGPGQSICPTGSYCDTTNGLCSLECDGAATGAYTCRKSGEVCGCDGRCAPQCKPVATVKPTLTVSPVTVNLVAPSGAATPVQNVAVTVAVPDASSAAAAGTFKLTAVADKGTLVSCASAGGAMSAAGASCVLDGLTLSASALSLTRQVAVSLRPVTAQLPQTDYTVVIGGDAVSTTPVPIAVHRLLPNPTPGSVADGIYEGTVTTGGTAGAALGDESVVGVKAYVSHGTVAIVDPTLTLSSRGNVNLNFGAAYTLCYKSGPLSRCFAVAPGDYSESWFADGNGGAFNVTYHPVSVTQPYSNGDLAVEFTQLFPGPQVKPIAYHVLLHPVKPLAACSATVKCSADTVCSSNQCVVAPVGNAAYSKFADHKMDLWYNAVTSALSDAPYWNDGTTWRNTVTAAYPQQPGTPYVIHNPYVKENVWGDLPATADSDLMGMDLAVQAGGNHLPLIANSGHALCARDFTYFMHDLSFNGTVEMRPQRSLGFWGCYPLDDGRGMENYIRSRGDLGNNVGPETAQILCDRTYAMKDQTSSCAQVDDTTESTLTWERNSYRIPCLTATPPTIIFGGGGGAAAPALPATRTCEQLYNRASANGNIAGLSYAQYLDQYCQIGAHDVSTIQSANDQYALRFCEAPQSLFGPMRGGAVAERFACYYPAFNRNDGDARLTTRLNNHEARFSGDLHCAADDRNGTPEHLPRAVPLYVDRDQFVDAGQTSRSSSESDMLASCARELSAEPSSWLENPYHAPNLSNPACQNGGGDRNGDCNPGYGAAVDMFGNESCFAPARFYGAVLGSGAPSKYLFRLMQQLVGAQKFLVTRSLAKWQTSDTIGAGNSCLGGLQDPSCVPPPPPPKPEDWLDTADGVWAFFLDSRVVTMLESAPADMFAYPDYRGSGEQSGGEDHEQGDALSVSLLQGLASYFDGVEYYLSRSSDATIEACRTGAPSPDRQQALARAGAAMRRGQSIATLAEDLVARAQSVNGSPSWSGHWDNARRSYLVARTKLAARLRAYLACSNSLGIIDNDTPIFFSDPNGPSAKTFAASDYLLGNFARPAVQDADKYLQAARASLTQMLQSQVSQVQADRAQADATKDIVHRYGSQLMDLCGAAAGSGIDYSNILSKFQDGTLKPETCFREVQLPRCDTVNASADCFHGKLGEAELALLSARQDILIAKQQHQDTLDRFTKQEQYCLDLRKSYDGDTSLMQQHLDFVKEAHKTSTFLSDLGAVVEGACAVAATVATGGAAAPLAVAVVGATLVANDAKQSVDDEQASYDVMMKQRSNDRDLLKCNHDTDDAFLGTKAAAMTAVKRGLDAENAMLHITNMEAQVRGLVAEGLDLLATQSSRTALPIARTFWYDENAKIYGEKMQWAKRMTYLAVQAVEYEFQQSSGARPLVLSARSPIELSQVLQTLDTIWGPRSAGRQKWQMVPYIFNLRDTSGGTAPEAALLSIDPRTVGASGPDANKARFRAMLTSPDYALYDNYGNYEGQGIPFSLTRENISITGDSLGVSCGERLWRVAAQISAGNQPAPIANSVSIEVRKAATFYSQLCNANGDSSHYQVAGILPGYNPFAGTSDGVVTGNTTRFLPATIEANRNGSQQDLLSTIPNEVNGIDYSDAFADWGLLGDYVLVFRWDGPLKIGFDLSQVDQVTLAFYAFRQINLTPPPSSTPLVP